MPASGSENHFHERDHDWQLLPQKKRGVNVQQGSEEVPAEIGHLDLV